MKALSISILAILLGFSGGCSVSSFKGDQRVVELPPTDPNSSLSTAARLGQDLWAKGFASDVQKQFPNLTAQQLQGVFITWNSGYFNGKKSVFLTTGIRYSGSLPEAKAIADYCEVLVKRAVAAKFPNANIK